MSLWATQRRLLWYVLWLFASVTPVLPSTGPGLAWRSGNSLLNESKGVKEAREFGCCRCPLRTPGTSERSLVTGNMGEEFILPGSLFWFLRVILCVGTEWVHRGESMSRRLET